MGIFIHGWDTPGMKDENEHFEYSYVYGHVSWDSALSSNVHPLLLFSVIVSSIFRFGSVTAYSGSQIKIIRRNWRVIIHDFANTVNGKEIRFQFHITLRLQSPWDTRGRLEIRLVENWQKQSNGW